MWFARVAECRMNLFNRHATLKPLKAHKAGKRSELSEYSKKTLATLGTGSMRQAVQLPPGENINEWSHTLTHTRTHTLHTQCSTRSHSVTATSAHRPPPLPPSLPLCLPLYHSPSLPISLPLSAALRRLAVNTVDFFNELSMLYGTVSYAQHTQQCSLHHSAALCIGLSTDAAAVCAASTAPTRRVL